RRKPPSYAVCEKGFLLESQLLNHDCAGEPSQRHTSNPLFHSSQCGTVIDRKHQLPTRQPHSGPNHLETEDVSISENPFSPSERKDQYEDKEKPPSYAVSEKGFLLESQLLNHDCAGEPSHCHSSNPLFHSSQCGTVIDRMHQLP
ncbi:hypothetical protein JOQ06_009036, partial [Pogonophryne albipinna]